MFGVFVPPASGGIKTFPEGVVTVTAGAKRVCIGTFNRSPEPSVEVALREVLGQFGDGDHSVVPEKGCDLPNASLYA